MRFAALVMLVAVSACAGQTLEPAGAPRQAPVAVTTDDGSDSFSVRITREEFVARTDLEVPVERVFAALSEAYQRVGLPAPELDPRSYLVAVNDVRASRRLGGVPLSHYLECGSSVTGAYADTHRVRLFVNTALEAAGPETTIVRTRVEATAAPTAGGGGTRTCTSMGALELQIAQWLHKLSIIGGT